MEFLSNMPWLAIFVATFLAFILAAFWYSPLLFGDMWRSSLGMQFDESKPSPGVMIMSFLSMMVTTVCFAAIVSYGGATSLSDYLVIALVLWLGFPLVGAVGAVLWAKYKPSFIFTEGGYMFLSLIITAVVFAWLV